jgi:sulfur carrier protein ThiS
VSRKPLARKRLRTTRFRFEVEDSETALVELNNAKTAQLLGRTRGADATVVAELEQSVVRAQKAYDDCFDTIEFRQNSDAVELYMQRIADRADDDDDSVVWWKDPASPEVELIASCAVDVDYTPAEWSEEITERLTPQDRIAILQAAMEANSRVGYNVGKG